MDGMIDIELELRGASRFYRVFVDEATWTTLMRDWRTVLNNTNGTPPMDRPRRYEVYTLARKPVALFLDPAAIVAVTRAP